MLNDKPALYFPRLSGPPAEEEPLRDNMNPRMLLLIVMLLLGFSACGGGGSSTTPPPITYTIGGSVSALSGSGLVLQDNGGDNLPVSADGTFTFRTALPSGSTYKVTVAVQPSSPAQTCGVTLGSGTVTANVTNIGVDCGHNEWTWEGGANAVNQAGTYGTLGTPAPGNVPGARSGSAIWTDTSGSLWLFGGAGYDSTGLVAGALNDLWKYSAGEWTWMGGANVVNQAGTYGTLGTPAPGNVPGARSGPVIWTDASGNVWLFGGVGIDSTGTYGELDDLWTYSAGQWAWMGGANVGMQKGTYGTQGTPAPGNIPGARAFAAGWADASGNFWLFGGAGCDSVGNCSDLNDLWKYSAGEWTWMSGANVENQAGTYGTQGTPAPGNVPGARDGAIAWTDASGNIWLFGGLGYDSTGTAGGGFLNDLWKYSAGEWTWMGESNVANQKGTYGTQGVPAPGNVPGARSKSVILTDATGNVWLFGGFGYDSTGAAAQALNDLWKYSAGQWTWMGGSNVINQLGTYGNLGVPAPGNVPGSRYSSVGWTDADGNFWLFSGYGFSAATLGSLNDVWKFEP